MYLLKVFIPKDNSLSRDEERNKLTQNTIPKAHTCKYAKKGRQRNSKTRPA